MPAGERDGMRVVVCLLIIAVSVSSAWAMSDRLKDADVFNGLYGSAWDDAAMERMKDMPFVVCPHPTKEIVEKAHKLNTRVIQYVTFYQVPKGTYFQHANIDDHPDWVCIHADGKEGESELHKGYTPKWVTTCPNSPDYRDYVLKTVRLLMAEGMDGLFIDNAHPDTVCEGLKFGKHQHIYPDKDNTYAYRKLLEDIRAETAKCGDKIIILNPGNPQESWVGACDGQMLESYICSWAWKDRWPERKILKYQKEFVSFPGRGCAIVALTYLGHTDNPPREDAFYCYAWARLSGFLWADWYTGKDCAKDLYVIRLGKASGPMETHDGYYSRTFANGMVVATSESKGASFRISAKDHPSVLDVFNAIYLEPGKSGDFEITLDKGQGRVYTW